MALGLVLGANLGSGVLALIAYVAVGADILNPAVIAACPSPLAMFVFRCAPDWSDPYCIA